MSLPVLTSGLRPREPRQWVGQLIKDDWKVCAQLGLTARVPACFSGGTFRRHKADLDTEDRSLTAPRL
jgi:hypothetical protein